MKKFIKTAAFAVLILAACASQTQRDIEEARFLLDQGEFDAAIALLEPIVTSEPANNEAKFLLGSALIGNFALSPKPGCIDTDTGYLGALACVLDQQEEGDDSGLKTFERIAPEDATLNDDINRAIDLLAEITTFSAEAPEQDVALQRLIARTFSISTVFQITGANSENVDCNAGGAGVDDVPDDYDSSNITTEDAERFEDNLQGIQDDATQAGLDEDFEILQRAQDILQDLNDTGFGTRAAVIEIFDQAYNTPAQQVCI